MTPDAPRTRSDLQAELRKTQRKERRQHHRWRRRTFYVLAFVLLLAAVGAGGLYLYATYRFDQIKKVHAKHLLPASAIDRKPFNLLLAGSDSRAFVSNSTQANAFGTESTAGGQRSDVTMVARFDPAAKTVTVLSIPRDLWVHIPGDVSGISGMNRINAAFNSGPDLLVQTIEQDFGIPINHYMAVNFPGFSGMVDALGGVTMDFPTEVRDPYTGLHVTTTGCQVVNGTTALELVRSRHLSYLSSNGYWEGDGLSDFSRIQRQDSFFRAVLAKVNQTSLNPFTINAFIGAAVTNLTIDDTFSRSDLVHLAGDFRGLSSSHLVTETLPTTSFTTAGGAAVLRTAQPYAQQMVDAFKQIGTTPVVHAAAPRTTPPAPRHPTPTTTTTTTTEPHGQVSVDVFNASSTGGLATSTAAALGHQGFGVNEIANASTLLSPGSASQVLYGPSGVAAANTLAAVLRGPVDLVADPAMSGSTVSLLIAGPDLTVAAPGSAASPGSVPSATTTTVAGPPSTTTTTIPADVYANTQPEPWNPVPCTLGHSTQAAPTSTTTKGAGSSHSR